MHKKEGINWCEKRKAAPPYKPLERPHPADLHADRAVFCLLPFENALPDKARFDGLIAFADGAFATGTDGFLALFDGGNGSVHNVENKLENAKIHSPLLGGIKGNPGRYVVRGAKAVSYIIRRRRSAK